MLLSIHRNGPVARRPGRSRILESDAPSPSRIVSSFTRDPDSECKQGSTVYGYPTAPAESLPPPSKYKQGSTVYGYPTAPAESSPLPQSVSRALLYTAIQQALLTPPPLPWSGEPIMPIHLEPVKLSLCQGRDSKPRRSSF